MTPVWAILKLSTEAEKIDLEMIGARLEHHNVKIQVDNCFVSDTGGRWQCTLSNYNEEEMEITKIEPSLRTAVLNALKGWIEEWIKKDKK